MTQNPQAHTPIDDSPQPPPQQAPSHDTLTRDLTSALERAAARPGVRGVRTPIQVELLGHYGGDETHAQSAWTSTNRDLAAKRDRIPSMLKQLAEAGHHTPFEKSVLHFLVTCDKATHIQLIKHRVGCSVNAESARYKELKDDRWYTPDDWPEALQEVFDAQMSEAHAHYHSLLARLVGAGVDRKRAKESARLVLPHASMITQDISFNFRSFMHFIGLRLDPHAQREVHNVACKMLIQTLTETGGAFTHSLEAFGWTSARLAAEEGAL